MLLLCINSAGQGRRQQLSTEGLFLARGRGVKLERCEPRGCDFPWQELAMGVGMTGIPSRQL